MFAVDLAPQEQSVVRKLGGTKTNAVSILLRSSIYCTALAGLFLYLALARSDPRYAMGIFGMFVLYLAIRIYIARAAFPESCRAFCSATNSGSRNWKRV